MDNDDNYEEIRCISDRKHTIRGTEYTRCGSILGAIRKGMEIDEIFHCTVCKSWFRITRDDPNSKLLDFEQLENRRYNFSQPLRIGR